MDVRAAVALAPAKPLEVTTVQLDSPRAGEVLVEIKATGICHTDEFTLSGAGPEGLFPAILGHEGAGIVVDVGAGVTSVQKGDHVIPLGDSSLSRCGSSRASRSDLTTPARPPCLNCAGDAICTCAGHFSPHRHGPASRWEQRVR